jgi:hypothetical protein
VTSGAEHTDFVRLYEQLAARSLADQALIAQRYRDLIQRASAGEIDPVRLRSEYDRLMTERSAALAKDLAALGASFYQSLLDLNRQYVDRLFDDLIAPGRPNGHSHHDEDERRAATMELHLSGALGDDLEASFAIENKRAEAADVVFLISDLTADDGEPVRAHVRIEPPRLRLGGHDEAGVTLRLPLDPDLFTAGGRYRGVVLVRGHDDLELQLSVDVSE